MDDWFISRHPVPPKLREKFIWSTKIYRKKHQTSGGIWMSKGHAGLMNMKPGFVWLSWKSIQWNLRKFSQSWGVLTFMDSESILYQSVWICIRWLWRIREIDLITKNDNCRWSIQQYSTCWPPPQTQSMILCTYPGKVDFPKPPQRKKFLQKLLVKGPGYLPGLCRWYLRLKQCDCTH